ncbi:Uma2 family endonuclease [Paracraurococcus lichenis]|uniref:Uma2 family endonuclease n=1 Tax=Paracraurococcus lichenis TaxID=3064888 RepID=A0ABT9DVE0_9PROT|nr:Uma2 family endonuclease [Paracraurococcus sp. LOR1-02]MDO9707848.1 Uma2 family endonuclease [Paracraurococcus sp. LOR1-02]
MAEPTKIPTHRMTLAEFYAWAAAQPDGRYELFDGKVAAMAPERAAHAATKAQAWLALRNAIRAAGLPCQAFVDGLAVEVSESRSYLPDVVVNCGERVAPESLVAPTPVIVVEVASPSTARIDLVRKLPDYFRIPSIQHYLILDADSRMAIHHRRVPDGTHATWIAGSGSLVLDPPGITIRVEDLFED